MSNDQVLPNRPPDVGGANDPEPSAPPALRIVAGDEDLVCVDDLCLPASVVLAEVEA
jgi:hypothetical protein